MKLWAEELLPYECTEATIEEVRRVARNSQSQFLPPLSVLIGAVARAHKRVIQESELAEDRGRISDDDRRENIRILGKVMRGEALTHEEQRFISVVGTDKRLLEAN